MRRERFIPNNVLQVNRFAGFKKRNLIEGIVWAVLAGLIINAIPFVVKVKWIVISFHIRPAFINLNICLPDLCKAFFPFREFCFATLTCLLVQFHKIFLIHIVLQQIGIISALFSAIILQPKSFTPCCERLISSCGLHSYYAGFYSQYYIPFFFVTVLSSFPPCQT